MDYLLLFLNAVLSSLPLVVAGAVLVTLLVNLGKEVGLVKDQESGDWLTAPRASAILNLLILVFLVAANLGGHVADSLEALSKIERILVLIVPFVGALWISSKAHETMKSIDQVPKKD